MNATTVASQIRRELKQKLGASARQVSVRTEHFGFSSCVKVHVKDQAISKSAVTRIAVKHEAVRYDPQGSVLRGLNLYIQVS